MSKCPMSTVSLAAWHTNGDVHPLPEAEDKRHNEGKLKQVVRVIHQPD